MYRNEVLDCRVYATAALLMREVNWRALVKNIERKKNPQPKPEEKSLDITKSVEPSNGLIHVVFVRGIRWKGNHVGPGTEMDVTITEARLLMGEGTIKDVNLPIPDQIQSAFKLPSTKQLRRGGLI